MMPSVEAKNDGVAGESFADQAYRRLEEMIVTLQFPPGTLLSEAGLSSLLGIGRTPVREALQRLAAEYLVEIMPRRGIQVTRMNVGHQLLLLETRRELERLIATRAARRSTSDEKQAFAVMADDIERAATRGDDVTFLRTDREFNAFISQCARNPFAAAAIAPLHALSRRFWVYHYRPELDMPHSAKLHAAVMRAVAAGNDRAAAAASDSLLDYVENFTRATLGERL